MFKIFLLLLVASAHCQKGSNSHIEALIKQVLAKTRLSNTSEKMTTTIAPRPSTLVSPSTTRLISTEDLPCKMPDGQSGVCVKFYLCNKNNTIIVDGVALLDIRFMDGECPSYLDTCCLPPEIRPPTKPITPKPELVRQGCGWANPKGADLRTTGETNGETKFGEFPWMVAIIRLEPLFENYPGSLKVSVYIGGGSLIHPSAVLTAAHIIDTAKEYRVKAGEWDTQTTKEIYPFQDRDIDSIVIHENFSKGNLFYDAAILFLKQPMVLAPNVGVACLPLPREITPAGTRCFATGWGKDKFGKEGRNQVILKKVGLPVVERSTCQTALRRTSLGRIYRLHTSAMCAGGERGIDVCKDDGGSPLSCPISGQQDRYIQSGIVSWGIGCGQEGIPGVYADVSILRDWIDDKMTGKSFDSTTYSYTT